MWSIEVNSLPDREELRQARDAQWKIPSIETSEACSRLFLGRAEIVLLSHNFFWIFDPFPIKDYL